MKRIIDWLTYRTEEVFLHVNDGTMGGSHTIDAAGATTTWWRVFELKLENFERGTFEWVQVPSDTYHRARRGRNNLLRVKANRWTGRMVWAELVR